MRSTYLIIALFFSLKIVNAQNGVLKGTVVDKNTGEELVGAAIIIDGTTNGTITNFMGEYELSPISSGTHTIKVQFISYEPQLFNNITINDDSCTELNIRLSPATMDIQEVQVVAKANRESENMLLMEQKKAVLAKQAIGAQELSRKGISDAEGAVTKMAGISKQEGVKNVFVRGLGDRYNSTMLNGFPVPSEDPEYKNISLDFFGSNVIQSIDVNKVFDAGNYGDVGGAVIDINSKELMGNSEFSIGGSWGANSATAGKNFITPDGVNRFGYAKPTGSASREHYSFKNSLNPGVEDFKINQSFNFTGGASSHDQKMNFFVTGSYGADYFFNEGVVRKTATTGRVDEDFAYEKFIRNTTHMLSGNLNYKLNANNNLSYNLMYIHANREYYGVYEGYDAEIENRGGNAGDEAYTIRQQVNDNTLLVNQLYADLTINDRLKFTPGIAVNYVSGNEPDRRLNRMISSKEDGSLRFMSSQTTQQRFFSELNEVDANIRAAFNYTLSENKISEIDFGYKGRITKRDFMGDIYGLELNRKNEWFDRNNLDLDDFFDPSKQGAPGESGTNFYVDLYENRYTVESSVHSAFGHITHELSPKLIVTGGLRMDYVNMLIDYNTVTTTPDETSINEWYILPSINGKYSFSDKHSLRGGLSKTYTMPQAKELAPFEYVGETFTSQGNPDLVPSQNYNADLKYDFYLSNDEVLSIGGFYKHIINPISRIEELSAAGYLTYRNIAPYATATGLEFEARKNIYKLYSGEVIKKLSMGLNGSYIYSHVKFDKSLNDWGVIEIPFTNESSRLEGAAPYIVNTDLTYNYKKNQSSYTAALVFNYTSEKLYTVGTSGFENTMESSIAKLDFVLSAKFAKHWGANIKAQNLLNPNYEITREPFEGGIPIVLSSFQKGASFSAGLTYNF